MNNNSTTLVDKWVVNAIILILVCVFAAIVFTVLALAWNQVVWHSAETTSYASEFVGILNSIILISIGVFFSSVVGKIFNIKTEDLNKNISQTVAVSKQAGLEMMVDKLQESPKIDNENNLSA